MPYFLDFSDLECIFITFPFMSGIFNILSNSILLHPVSTATWVQNFLLKIDVSYGSVSEFGSTGVFAIVAKFLSLQKLGFMKSLLGPLQLRH